MLRRMICVLLMITFAFTVKAYALSARSAILIEAQSGKVLMEKDAYTKRPMASITKVMTALIALEKGNLNDIVTVSRAAHLVEGSSIWLEEGEKIKLEDLLYGLMLNSGNDAATAIAEHIAGSVPKFVKLMNSKAQEMGLKNTSFDNPHGLNSEKHYTTAYDFAQITREAMKNPKFAEIVATKSKKIPWADHKWDRSLKNHNRLLFSYEGANGVKTGYTKKSGRTLVSAAKREGVQLIAITLNASDDWNDHRHMLDYGFSKCKSELFINKDEYIKTLPVKNGSMPYAQVVAKDKLSVTLIDGEDNDINVKYDLPDTIKAPVVKGQIVGSITANLNGKQVDLVELICQNSVAKVERIKFKQRLYQILLTVFTVFR